MLNTLLDITEAEAGMMKLRRERVDLCRMVREVVELYEDVADQRKVTVRTGGKASRRNWKSFRCVRNGLSVSQRRLAA